MHIGLTPKNCDQHNINTSSKIILPGKHHVNQQKRIRWFRLYNNITQQLHYMEDLLFYECSPLDLDCQLEAHIQYLQQGATTVDKITYGPIKFDSLMSINLETYHCIKVFSVFQGNHLKQVELLFDPTGIIIKAHNIYALTNQQISSIYIPTVKQSIIIIGSLTQNNFALKVHADGQLKLSGYLPIKINLMSSQPFFTALYHINRLKLKNSKVSPFMNQLNHTYSRETFNKPSNLSTDILDLSTPTHSNNPVKTADIGFPTKKQQKNMKGSQLVKGNTKDSNLMASENNYPTSVQNQKKQEYLDEFDMLFQDQQHDQQLCLNQSFDQLQKKSLGSKNLDRMKQIQIKKERKKTQNIQKNKIQQKIDKLIQQRQKLTNANKKLKNEVEILCRKSTVATRTTPNQLQAMVNSMRRYMNRLQQDILNIKKQLKGNSKIISKVCILLKETLSKDWESQIECNEFKDLL